jgi:hypothetical protein
VPRGAARGEHARRQWNSTWVSQRAFAAVPDEIAGEAGTEEASVGWWWRRRRRRRRRRRGRGRGRGERQRGREVSEDKVAGIGVPVSRRCALR